MNDELERFKLLIKLEDIELTWLAKETGIKRQRWADVKNGRAKLLMTEGAIIGKIYPEYAYWLITGNEMPEAGQISPMTKRAHTNSKTAPKVG